MEDFKDLYLWVIECARKKFGDENDTFDIVHDVILELFSKGVKLTGQRLLSYIEWRYKDYLRKRDKIIYIEEIPEDSWEGFKEIDSILKVREWVFCKMDFLLNKSYPDWEKDVDIIITTECCKKEANKEIIKRQRKLFIFLGKAVGERSYKEIAELLDMDYFAVQKAYKRIQEKVKKSFMKMSKNGGG